MDAKKTGAFIALLRKEKGYTQKELANRIQVSDKAISRWETGKGFPDTSLLKPLSDVLGVSVGELLSGERIQEEQVKSRIDNVLLTSIQRSDRKITAATAVSLVLAMVVAVLCVVLFLSGEMPVSAVDFINNSRTQMLYDLAGTEDGTQYGGFLRTEYINGWEWYLPDGSQRYVFSEVSGSSEPVLSYLHCSGEGMLFGFAIGEATVIRGNETVGAHGYSLREYLRENGFQLEREASVFGRPSLQYIHGERCNWYAYIKENVWINICVSAYEGNQLMAYDIGIRDDSLNKQLEGLRAGYPVSLLDPTEIGVVLEKTYYVQWESVVLTAPAEEMPLYVWVNGQMAGKMTADLADPELCRFEFAMPGAPATVIVTQNPEK